MRLNGIYKLVFIVILISKGAVVIAQLSADDSLFYKTSINNTVQIFHQNISKQSGIYNGKQYGGYPFSFKEGHPFFLTEEFNTGSLVYDNIGYPDLQLLYDELSDVVIFQNKERRIALLNERISSFSILNYNFVRIVVADTDHVTPLKTGFYNLLYDGKTQVLKQEVKKMIEEAKSSVEGVYHFIQIKNLYYIKKEGKYYSIKNKKTLYSLFADKKKEIQHFIKSNHLSFRKDKDTLLIKVTAWYDQSIQ
jgi:hypothetical protein